MWGKKKKALTKGEDDKQSKFVEKDKIFNNTYGEQDLGGQKINFTVAAGFGDGMDPDDKQHYDSLFDVVDMLIKGSEFEHLNEATPDGVIKKLNKVQINKVFFYIIENTGRSYTRIDLFSVLSDYFDVFPNKFYNSLSNKFKDELIEELEC